MKIRTLLNTALTMGLLVSCALRSNGETDGSPAISDPEPEANFGFIENLGINLDKVNVIGDDYDFQSSAEKDLVSITAKQRNALLDDFFHFIKSQDDEDAELSRFTIAGIRALQDGYSMVIFLEEYGDGSDQYLATYDPKGKPVDLIDSHTSHYLEPIEANEDYTLGKAYKTKMNLDFEAADQFKIQVGYALVDWKSVNDQPKATKQYWEIDRSLSYQITPEGKFKLLSIKPSNEGNPPEESLLSQDIADLGRYPLSDPSRIDKLNAMLARPDIVKLQKEDSPSFFWLTILLREIYQTTPQQLLEWMAAHRSKDNHLVALFEKLFSDGLVRKETLISDIEQMKDPDAKKYISELTSQWGPADAVG